MQCFLYICIFIPHSYRPATILEPVAVQYKITERAPPNEYLQYSSQASSVIHGGNMRLLTAASAGSGFDWVFLDLSLGRLELLSSVFFSSPFSMLKPFFDRSNTQTCSISPCGRLIQLHYLDHFRTRSTTFKAHFYLGS